MSFLSKILSLVTLFVAKGMPKDGKCCEGLIFKILTQFSSLPFSGLVKV